MTTKRSSLLLTYAVLYLVLVKLDEVFPALPIWFQTVAYPILAVAALVFFIRAWQPDWERLRNLRFKVLTVLGLAFLANLVLAILATSLSSLLLEVLGVSDYVLQNDQSIGQALREIPYAWFFLAGAICGPFVEEVIFRYLLFGTLRKRLALPLALSLQALLFGLLHVHAWNLLEVVSVLPHMASGLVFAYLYHREGTIYLPIALHMLWNAFGLLGMGATG